MAQNNNPWILNHGDLDSIAFNTFKPVFLFDTGTIIDFEQNYRKNHNTANHPAEVLGRVEHPIIITNYILNELNYHNKHTEIQAGKIKIPLVSDSTLTLLKRLHEESNEIMKDSGVGELEIDVEELEARDLKIKIERLKEESKEQSFKGLEKESEKKIKELTKELIIKKKIIEEKYKTSAVSDNYRYLTYLASGHAFKEDYRKGVKDIVSFTDRDLVSKAFLLSQGKFYGESPGGVYLLSTDQHVIKTAKVLKSHENFKNHEVNPIHTREGIIPHLLKGRK